MLILHPSDRRLNVPKLKLAVPANLFTTWATSAPRMPLGVKPRPERLKAGRSGPSSEILPTVSVSQASIARTAQRHSAHTSSALLEPAESLEEP
jgi:hypothetical protein